MSNYLSVDNGGKEIDSGFPGPAAEVSGSVSNGIGSGFPGNPDNLSPSTGSFSALGAGSGSKPIALHTEYAENQAEWDKPYAGGTDIKFYLMRADQG